MHLQRSCASLLPRHMRSRQLARQPLLPTPIPTLPDRVTSRAMRRAVLALDSAGQPSAAHCGSGMMCASPSGRVPHSTACHSLLAFHATLALASLSFSLPARTRWVKICRSAAAGPLAARNSFRYRVPPPSPTQTQWDLLPSHSSCAKSASRKYNHQES
jgi:hypothetical protein